MWLIWKFWSISLPLNLKFLSSAYLSYTLKSNVGCFMMGPLILGPTFSALAVPAMDMVWIATLTALATACAMYSLVLVCSLAILASLYDWSLCSTFQAAFVRLFFYHLDLLRLPIFSVPNICAWACLCETLLLLRLPVLSLPNISCFSLPLWDFYSWHHVAYLALVKMTLMYDCKRIFLLCVNEIELLQ